MIRLRIKDEVSGAETALARAFRVPRAAHRRRADDRGRRRRRAGADPGAGGPSGTDSLLLLPPAGRRGAGRSGAPRRWSPASASRRSSSWSTARKQLTRGAPPFSAEVRLARFPTEQIVRAEGYDAEGKLVAADEVIVNQPRGALGVWIIEPPKGSQGGGGARPWSRPRSRARRPADRDRWSSRSTTRSVDLPRQAALAAPRSTCRPRRSSTSPWSPPWTTAAAPRPCASCARRSTSRRWTSTWSSCTWR